MNSIDQVLRIHGEHIRTELLQAYVTAARGNDGPLVRDIILTNDIYEIDITAVLRNGQELVLRGISIDELAERFPDCDVAY
ncbi:MAG: hypothetical protein ACLPND_17830 [Candidatus Korobacteraceae bacterium]